MHNILTTNNFIQGRMFISMFIYLFFLIGIFLLLRQIVLWYWKINRIEELLTRQNELLAEIAQNTRR